MAKEATFGQENILKVRPLGENIPNKSFTVL